MPEEPGTSSSSSSTTRSRIVGADPLLSTTQRFAASSSAGSTVGIARNCCKELFVWGLRCGFLTFGPGRADTAEEVCAVLDAKVRGAVRAGVSNSPQLSQTLVEQALASSSIAEERKEKCEILRSRAERVYEEANAPRYRESFSVHPFNSGYFMCLEVKGVDAETLRVHLLDRYGAGLIATGASDLRIAFSCLEQDEVEPLFELIHKGIQELRED